MPYQTEAEEWAKEREAVARRHQRMTSQQKAAILFWASRDTKRADQVLRNFGQRAEASQ